MDPFSITGTCVGLVATIATLTQQITQFVGDVRDSARDMGAIRRELSDLSFVVERLRDDTSGGNIHYPADLQERLPEVLTNCEDVMTDIQTVLQKMSSGKMKRMQWAATGQTEVKKLKSRLNAHKMTIEMALSMITLSLLQNVKHDTSDIKDDTNAIRQDTAQIPQIADQLTVLNEEIASLKIQLSQEEKLQNPVLQRFVDSSTEYAESIVHQDEQQLSEDEQEQDQYSDSSSKATLAVEHEEGDLTCTEQLSVIKGIAYRDSDGHDDDEDRAHDEQGSPRSNSRRDKETNKRTGRIAFSSKDPSAHSPRTAATTSTATTNTTTPRGTSQLAEGSNESTSRPHIKAQANSTSAWSLLDMFPKSDVDRDTEHALIQATINTPRIDVQEKNRQDTLKASAIAMAHKMHAMQQKTIGEAAGKAEGQGYALAVSGARISSVRDNVLSNSADVARPSAGYEDLEEAARRLAQERHRNNHYTQSSPSTSNLSTRLSPRRASSAAGADDDSDEEQSRRIKSQMSISQSGFADTSPQISPPDAKSRFQFSAGYPRAVSSSTLSSVDSQSDHRPAQAVMKVPVLLSSIALPDLAPSASASSPARSAKNVQKVSQSIRIKLSPVATRELELLFCDSEKPIDQRVPVTVDQVRLLWARGADVNNTGGEKGEGWPLLQAASKGNFKVVHYLLSQGANAQLGPALANACRLGEERSALETIGVLLAFGVGVNDHPRTLICAAENSTPKVVKFLIGQGADVFVKSLMLRDGIGVIVSPITSGDALKSAKNRSVTDEPTHTREIKEEIIRIIKEAQSEAKRKKKQKG